ncbi:hypothetical protein ZIOFF_042660 [Zingiber officinale]|uniref:Uncharacterized protein n=1 Tax=Zingiber officinale TaxID=94328 RepID=A0A8J5KVN4_ZINOF|nr:hypothetical protein ZIOFF_042660 [Zingiber officinale]
MEGLDNKHKKQWTQATRFWTGNHLNHPIVWFLQFWSTSLRTYVAPGQSIQILRRWPETEVEVVVVVEVTIAVDDGLNAAEVVDGAGNGDGALVAEAILLLRRLQQLREQRVAQVQ